MRAVERRATFARTVQARSIDEPRAAWDRTIAAVASSPLYGGLRLRPLLGLVPLGTDLDSGLEEFAHLQSGTVPSPAGIDQRERAERADAVGVVTFEDSPSIDRNYLVADIHLGLHLEPAWWARFGVSRVFRTPQFDSTSAAGDPSSYMSVQLEVLF